MPYIYFLILSLLFHTYSYILSLFTFKFSHIISWFSAVVFHYLLYYLGYSYNNNKPQHFCSLVYKNLFLTYVIIPWQLQAIGFCLIILELEMTDTLHLTLGLPLDVNIMLKGEECGGSCLAEGHISAYSQVTCRGSWETHISHIQAKIRYIWLSYYLTTRCQLCHKGSQVLVMKPLISHTLTII